MDTKSSNVFCPLTCKPTCSSLFLPPWALTLKRFQISQTCYYDTCWWNEAKIKVGSTTLQYDTTSVKEKDHG